MATACPIGIDAHPGPQPIDLVDRIGADRKRAKVKVPVARVARHPGIFALAAITRTCATTSRLPSAGMRTVNRSPTFNPAIKSSRNEKPSQVSRRSTSDIKRHAGRDDLALFNRDL